MKTSRGILILLLLLTCGATTATLLEPRVDAWTSRSRSGNLMEVLLGDSRKMFANQFSVKADITFHSGYYPTIFDDARKSEEEENAVAHPEEHEQHAGGEEAGFLGKPTDWIDRFGRHFRPVVHTHLQGENTREILPWLRISASLDPHHIETYTVAAYWLTEQLHKPDDAEKFLREGLDANPGDPELLYELGHLELKFRHNLVKAENLLRASLRRWDAIEGPKKKDDQDQQLLRKILGGLGEIAIEEKHLDQAIEYFTRLKEVSPDPNGVQAQIDDLRAGKLPQMK
jgi:hypothetical protein